MNNAYKVDVVFPVYYKNIDILEESVVKVLKHLNDIQGPYLFNVLISINGPKAEKIIEEAETICRKYSSVNHIYTKQQGKGHGVLVAWRCSSADILTYMDIDLATSLTSFRRLIDEIREGANIAVGSRYLTTSKITRTFKRYALSRIYHTFFINMFLKLPVKDVQCGFKAIEKCAFDNLSPNISDHVFFFEAEILFLAYNRKMKIVEIPVCWTECTVSGVKLFSTSLSFIGHVFALRLRYLFQKSRFSDTE